MKNFLKYLIIIIIIMSAAFLSVMKFYRYFEFNLSTPQIIFVILSFATGICVFYFISIIFHELGHAVMGKINGFKLYQISFLFLTFLRKNGKWRVVLRRSKYAGVIISVPVSSKNLYKRYGAMVSGGLIGTLVSALGFLFTMLFVQFSEINGIYFYAALSAGFIVSLYLLIINSIPAYSNGIATDGGIIYGILKKNSETNILINILNIQSQFFAGLSPSEINQDFYFNTPVIADNNVNKIFLLNYRHAYYLDKFDFENADKTVKQLGRLKEYIPDMYLNLILADEFFNTVFYDKNNVLGENLYLKIEKILNEDANIYTLRIKMAYELFVKENPKLAIATGKTALLLKDEYLLKGVAKMEEKLINHLIDIAEKMIMISADKKPNDTDSMYLQ